MMPLWSLALLVGLAGAEVMVETPEDKVVEEFSIDPMLVGKLTEAPEGLIREEPYIAHFRKGEYNLYYVSASHESKLGSPTHTLIDRALAKWPVKRLVLEGRPYADGPVGKDSVARVRSGIKDGAYEWGETDHALLKAEAKGAKSVGGEPAQKDLLHAALDEGYATKDVLALFFHRMIPAYRRQGRLVKDGPRRLFDETMDGERKGCGIEPDFEFTYDDFLSWHKAKLGEGFDSSKVDGSLPPDPNGNFLQQLGDVLNQSRNRFLADVLTKELRAFKHVLVVYGNGHHAAQRVALVSAMGEPVYEGDLKK